MIIIFDVKNSPVHPSNVLKRSNAHYLQQLRAILTVLLDIVSTAGKNRAILSHVHTFTQPFAAITQTEGR